MQTTTAIPWAINYRQTHPHRVSSGCRYSQIVSALTWISALPAIYIFPARRIKPHPVKHHLRLFLLLRTFTRCVVSSPDRPSNAREIQRTIILSSWFFFFFLFNAELVARFTDESYRRAASISVTVSASEMIEWSPTFADILDRKLMNLLLSGFLND